VQALLPWEGSFQELLKQSAVTLGLDIQKLVPIAGELEDIGPVVIIRREGVIIKARCGPMQESQAKALLQDQDSLPPVGFYVDIDQHQSDTGPLAESEIVARVKTWNARNWAALADYEQQILKAASLA
jgi:hypothetical protein